MLRLAPHFYKEYDVHLAASYPNLAGIEWFDWLDSLVKNPIDIREGLAVVSNRPDLESNSVRKRFANTRYAFETVGREVQLLCPSGPSLIH